MRYLLPVLFLSVLFSCNNTDKTTETTTTETQATKETGLTPGDRQALVNELTKLKTALASKDKDKIMQLFKFPIIPEEGQWYVDDSTLEANKGKISEKVFLENFEKIYNYLSFDALPDCISNVHIDSLRLTDTLEDNLAIRKEEPCFDSYQAVLSHDTLTIERDGHANDAYTPKKDEGDSVFDGCESNFIWLFRLDGQKLVFIRHIAAG